VYNGKVSSVAGLLLNPILEFVDVDELGWYISRVSEMSLKVFVHDPAKLGIISF
jgi:hypothetical protein